MELVWEEEGRESSVPIGPKRSEILVGRHKDCDVRLKRSSVSRRHCIFTWTDGKIVVTDNGSTAGTFIDGKRVKRARVAPGTQVNCGGVMVLLDATADAKKAEAKAKARANRADPFFDDPRETQGGGSKDIDDYFDDAPPKRRDSGRSSSKSVDDFFDDEPAAPSKPSGGSKSIDDYFDDEPPPKRSRSRSDDGDSEKDYFAAETIGDFEDEHIPIPVPEDDGAPSIKDIDDYFNDSPAPKRRSRGDGAEKAAQRQVRRGVDDFFSDADPFEDDLPEPEPEPEPEAAPAPRPRDEHVSAYLLYVDDAGDDIEVFLGKGEEPVMVGRREGADILTSNKSVSSKHCTVSWVDDELMVRDLGSSNGTYINGERIRRSAIKDGDVLSCGRFELRLAFIKHKDIAEAEYEEWGEEEDWSDDEDMGPPRWHVIFSDDRGDVTSVTMSEDERVLAIGSDGCEICVTNRGVDPEHCELVWEDGVLIANDLSSSSGTFVDGEQIEEQALRNGEVMTCADLKCRIVRGCSSEKLPPDEDARSQDASFWFRQLETPDDELELFFTRGDEKLEEGRVELTVWGTGEGRLDWTTPDDSVRFDFEMDRDLRRTLYLSLVVAGFPDVKTDKVRADELPPELQLFHGDNEARVTLSKHLVQRTPGYSEVVALLHAVADEIVDG